MVSAQGSTFNPSEKRHEAARGTLRSIEAEHVPRSLSKKCCFPRLEIKANGGVWRCIVITHINRYCVICGQGLFRAYSGHNLIENKLYSGTT